MSSVSISLTCQVQKRELSCFFITALPSFSSSLLDGTTSVFDSTGADADTLFDNPDDGSQSGGYRGRLPGRLSSSALGISTEPIRSVNHIFPRPDLNSVIRSEVSETV